MAAPKLPSVIRPPVGGGPLMKLGMRCESFGQLFAMSEYSAQLSIC